MMVEYTRDGMIEFLRTAIERKERVVINGSRTFELDIDGKYKVDVFRVTNDGDGIFYVSSEYSHTETRNATDMQLYNAVEAVLHDRKFNCFLLYRYGEDKSTHFMDLKV